ncbi:hypothetical protein V9T40_008836 [Parthenolecanium corni]|uniref:Uncharacterized protein n=1 Tax=Parthenolecanium corni TaxID=536013 RepID=A0AAN9TLM1_9HEMI
MLYHSKNLLSLNATITEKTDFKVESQHPPRRVFALFSPDDAFRHPSWAAFQADPVSRCVLASGFLILAFMSSAIFDRRAPGDLDRWFGASKVQTLRIEWCSIHSDSDFSALSADIMSLGSPYVFTSFGKNALLFSSQSAKGSFTSSPTTATCLLIDECPNEPENRTATRVTTATPSLRETQRSNP